MAADDPVIDLQAVTKTYRRLSRETRTLQGMLQARARAERPTTRTAVEELSLSVGPGEMVGLIGGNGAGKSTTLRLAAGLTLPTSGTVRLHANSAAVLSLGETFALDLTGRENAITSAIVSGASPREAREMLPAIIDFAELEDAEHEPVRVYSEGMKLRLAFAVVAQRPPQALLLDEVMSVGDLSFQRRSSAWIDEARDHGCGLLVASHDLTQLTAKADRLIWLEHGRVRLDGAPETVAAAYHHAMIEETYRRTGVAAAASDRIGTQEVRIEGVELTGAPGAAPGTLAVGDPLALRFRVERPQCADAANIAVVIRDANDRPAVSLTTERSRMVLAEGTHALEMELQIDRLDLVPGDYTVEIGAYRADWGYVYDLHVSGYPLQVIGESIPDGVMAPPHRWVAR